MNMRVAVIGAGAIGGWLTAACVKGGASAIVLARGASYEALKADGLIIDDGETVETHRVEVTKDASDLRGADILLLGLKAHDLPGAAPLIEAAVDGNTAILPAINGLPWWFLDNFGGPAQGLRIEAVDPDGVLSRLMAPERIVGSVVHAASYVAAPGRIRLVKATKVWLGNAGRGQNAAEVTALLTAGGIPAEQTDKLHWHVWNKLWGNSNANPMSALARADLSQLHEDRYTRSLMEAIMREMSAVGEKIGLQGFDDPQARIAQTQKLGPIRTSMLQDVEAGRALEIDPILGGLVELARHIDVPTPAMDAVYGLTRVLDRNLRS